MRNFVSLFKCLLVFMENSAGWMSLVLQRFLVYCISLFMQSSLFKVLSPGHIQGSCPGADAPTEDLTVQGNRVHVITCL